MGFMRNADIFLRISYILHINYYSSDNKKLPCNIFSIAICKNEYTILYNFHTNLVFFGWEENLDRKMKRRDQWKNATGRKQF